MSSISSPTRLTGFSGTLDTESIIRKLMDAERVPLDNILKKKQQALWQREDYQSMNTKLLSFKTTVNNLRFESSFEKVATTSSNTSVLDVTTSGSNAGTATVEVTKLAASAMIIGKINGSSSTAVSTTGSFTIEGAKGPATINYTAGTSTIDSIIKDINSNSAATGVRASFDPNSNSLYLTGTTTGASSKVVLGGDVPFTTNASSAYGSDAEYYINDSTKSFKLTSSSNSVSINGNQVTLKSLGTASITSATDRSAVMDKLKSFVEQYNSLIDTFSTAITTKKNRDYEPLTDAQKESMSDSQIEKWEAKAREGTLYNDSILKDTLFSMRNGLNTPLNVPKGDVALLSQIGINVMSAYTDNGKLVIDETKLQDAISNNFDAVKKLFATGSTDPEQPGKTNLGIADRLYNTVNTQLDAIKKKIGNSGSINTLDDSAMGKQLKELSNQEITWTNKLKDIEDRYYKQFSAMEQALQKLNNQSSMFSSMR